MTEQQNKEVTEIRTALAEVLEGMENNLFTADEVTAQLEIIHSAIAKFKESYNG